MMPKSPKDMTPHDAGTLVTAACIAVGLVGYAQQKLIPTDKVLHQLIQVLGTALYETVQADEEFIAILCGEAVGLYLRKHPELFNPTDDEIMALLKKLLGQPSPEDDAPPDENPFANFINSLSFD